jgi:hypothetical protein
MRPAAGGAHVDAGGHDVPTAAWLDRLAYALDPLDEPALTHRRGQPVVTTIKNVPPSSLAQALLEVLADIGRQEITAAVRVATNSQASDDEVAAALESLTRLLRLPSRVDVSALTSAFRDALRHLRPHTIRPWASIPGSWPSGPRDQTLREHAADALSTALLDGVMNARVTSSWRTVAAQWPGVEQESVDEAVDALASVYREDFGRLRFEAALTKLGPLSPIAPTLRRTWGAAAGRIDDFRTGVEAYLDAEMTHLSGGLSDSMCNRA